MLKEQVLDVKGFSQRKATLTYPNIELSNISDATPLVVTLLESGSMPVVGVYSGKRLIVSRVSDSPYNISKLIRTHGKLIYNKTEEDAYELQSVEDYLNVL